MSPKVKLAVIVTHPIQHFAPWHRAVAELGRIHLRVLFCCDWGLREYDDPEFATSFKWDIPLVEGYEHEFLPIARRPRRLSFLQVDNPSIGEALDRFQPDVIQGFGYATRTIWRARRWAKVNTRPFMVFSDSSLTSQPPWWKRGMKALIVRGFYREVDGAFAVGDNNRAYHLFFGVPPHRIFVGRYPVDSERLRDSVPDHASARSAVREEFGIPASAFVALFCGKLSKRKRPHDIVQAAAVLQSVNSAQTWFVLVGEGPLRRDVEKRIRSLGLQNVTLTGFVNQSSLPRIYVGCDILLVPSAYDPHPLVVTEGATFGLPVVVSDRVGCIGPTDTARSNENAIVFPCGDTRALASAILRLQEEHLLRSRMAKTSYDIAAGQSASGAAIALSEAVEELARLGRR